jgi:MFS family permease
MMAQMGAMNMQMVSRAWLVYELTDDTKWLGGMALANAVPMLFFALFGGVMADRIQKKAILAVGQGASAVIALVIAVAVIVDVISLERQAGVWFLIAASVAQGIVMGLMMPSRQAIIPELVGSARLMNAVALNTAGMNINRLMAPAVAGLLIALVGIQTVYLAMTGLYVIGLVLVSRLKATGTISLGRGGALADMLEGLRYVRGNTMARDLLILTLMGVLLSMPYMFLMPVFAKDVQIVGPGEYSWLTSIPLLGALLADVPGLLTESSFRLGLLMSVSGIGALVGSLWIASMSNRNRGNAYIWSVAVLGVFLALYSVVTVFALGLLMIIGVGFGQSARMALSNGLVQDSVDDEHRGRVMSIYMMEFGFSSFSTFAVSALADVTGVQWAVGGTALFLIPLALYYYAFNSNVRRLQ